MLFTEKLRPGIDILNFDLLKEKNVQAEVLRLDKIDPVVSGNKWFKLKEYINEAVKNNKKTIVTFGGAYSNHILATASFCKQNNLRSIGIIRGELPKILSQTLIDARKYEMELVFVEREQYKRKEIPESILKNYADTYVIGEGGYGMPGMVGAKHILDLVDAKNYSHILSAVGTGTTLAGLVEASESEQKVIGISSLKNNLELEGQVNLLLSVEKKNSFQLLHEYHFGGYAKYTEELIKFMNEWYSTTRIPSDFAYTGKMFFAFNDLLEQGFFPAHSDVLLIHTGGLQGNRSLKKGTLIF